jgi:type IV pilus assembly protein PilX
MHARIPVQTHRTTHTGRRQAGASLLFALVTLVALALAASALVRSVDTGAVVLGNLGSKKATSIAADRATQLAIQQLAAMAPGTLQNDSPNAGYYATSKEDYDLTGFDRTDTSRKLVNWDIDGSCTYAAANPGTCDPATRPTDKQVIDADGRLNAQWLITRLCTANLSPKHVDNNCAVPLKGSLLKDQGTGEMTHNLVRPNLDNASTFFRIVVRVTGPRNAVTYTETIVNLQLTS